ncbi:MAG: Bacterial type secretion system protein domain protein [Mycobacterium sp.]|nr:Bacterial type secretion system protein domain protein [Mycobacterium sp.]
MLYVAMLITAVGLGLSVVAGTTALARSRAAMLRGESLPDIYTQLVPEGVLGPGGLLPEPTEPSLLVRVGEPLFLRAADLVSHVSPTAARESRRKRLVYAGLDGIVPVERVLGFKAAAAAVGLTLGVLLSFILSFPVWLTVLVPAVMGYFVPDAILSSKADDRQADIGRDLPEAIDLLAVTVEAGLGLEQAIAIVGENLEGPLGDELHRLLKEIELGIPRREALAALRDRVSVPELSAFVVALIQADRMGVAVSDVLKVQAHQVRLKRRQHARETAAKTPVKILFPVIFLILPSLFVITLGPAAITIMTEFSRTS